MDNSSQAIYILYICRHSCTHTYIYREKKNKWQIVNTEKITLNLLKWAFVYPLSLEKYALGQLAEHFHEVKVFPWSWCPHWAAQAPHYFILTDSGMKHLELLGKSIISGGRGIISNKIKDNKTLNTIQATLQFLKISPL